MFDPDSLQSDDFLTALRATRDAIVSDLGNCESMRDKAAFYARLESVLKLIEQATPETLKVGDPVDEITARRASRGAASASLQRRATSD